MSQEVSRDAGFALSEGRDIRDFKAIWGRVSGLKVCTGCRMPKKSIRTTGLGEI